MIGYYAERIACSGCVGIVCTSGGPLVHAHGGVDRVLSTNPIAFGIPTEARDPDRLRYGDQRYLQRPHPAGRVSRRAGSAGQRGGAGRAAYHRRPRRSAKVQSARSPATRDSGSLAVRGDALRAAHRQRVRRRARGSHCRGACRFPGAFHDCSRPPGLRRRSGVPRRSECLRRRDRDIEAGSRVGNHSHARAAGLRRAREAPSRWQSRCWCATWENHLGTRRRPRGPRARRLKTSWTRAAAPAAHRGVAPVAVLRFGYELNLAATRRPDPVGKSRPRG